MFTSTLEDIGDRSLATMRVVGETCTLADMEVVEHEERRQVSQQRGAYRAANEGAYSLGGLLRENFFDHASRY